MEQVTEHKKEVQRFIELCSREQHLNRNKVTNQIPTQHKIEDVFKEVARMETYTLHTNNSQKRQAELTYQARDKAIFKTQLKNPTSRFK